MKPQISMGMMADDFDSQLDRLGIAYNAANVSQLTADMRAVSRLRLRGILTGSAGDKAYDRVARNLWKEVLP